MYSKNKNLFLLFALVFSGCSKDTPSVPAEGGTTETQIIKPAPSPPTPTGTKNITVRWNPNKEKGVNSTGGGYKVYYSQTSNFSVSSANFISVPFTSGTFAPTSATISKLNRGTYYIKVLAYSSLNPSGNISQEITVNIP